jgi:nucleotide-binding universal stress UspA family protein
MKILIGIDDSSCSQAALEFVKKTRWPAASRFFLVSAVPLGSYAFAEAGSYVIYQEAQAEQRKAHEELTAKMKRDLETGGLAAESRVLLGDPREALIRMAEEVGADLIVVGSHGRSGLPKLLLGSVASHVVTHAPCSVLVVKKRHP